MVISDRIDKRRFEEARIKVLTGNHDPHGFGTLAEKTVHAVMKQYYLPNEDYHEVPIGNYIADIYTGEEIIEIQNANFGHMRDKLAAFLPEYQVYLVYPFPHKRWIIWLDAETGEVKEKNLVRMTGSIYHALPEFFRIKAYLTDPNLHIRVPLIDMEEYRLLDGKRSKRSKKIGSHRYDRVPVELVDEVVIDEVRDYLQLLPYDLPEEFTTADMAKTAHINKYLAQETLKLLYDIGIVARVGKRGKAYIYRVYEEL
ncbi:MAG: hypothetical protein IJ058_08125 [Lachnospiraceae bacterium]|nr:hypothetical protein [Lachnospiraceae bacterium]